MGGSGGTFSGRNRSPAEIAKVLQEDASVKADQFSTTLAQEFSRLLSQFNARDTVETAERLQTIKDALHDQINGSFDTLFGGSVAKHTYVDGISDVDSMLVISGDVADAKPDSIMNKVATVLTTHLAHEAEVSVGRVAVTVKYHDGGEIQLVPCLPQSDGRLQVPAWETNSWSTIDPQKFRDGLTKRNEECNGKLIPTLKLAKAVNSTLPESAQLSGYHIESLGVAAFRNYEGEKVPVKMLPHFFKRASELVLTPMTDRTGQSVHVDQHLGAANSDARRALSHTLARMHQRMVNSSAAGSRERWLEILGD